MIEITSGSSNSGGGSGGMETTGESGGGDSSNAKNLNVNKRIMSMFVVLVVARVIFC